MANPTQAPNPVEPLPRTLQDWLARDDASARFNKGDAYIATRTWKCDQDVQTVKVFGDQTIDDVAQRQIGDFPNRDSGVWHADPNLRKARWIEIVGAIEIDGVHPGWIHAVCERIGLRSAIFDRSRDHPKGPSRFLERYDIATVVDYGHVTHVKFNTTSADLHVFMFQTNEIVTICDYQPTSAGFPAKLSEPMFTPPPQGKANAAAVLWKVISLLMQSLEDTSAEWVAQVRSLFEKLDTGGRTLDFNEGEFNNAMFRLDTQVGQPFQHFDQICRHFLDDQGPLEFRRHLLMESDMKAEFERLSHNCKQLLRGMEVYSRGYDGLRRAREAEQSVEANRIAQKQEAIAAEQAQSAVVLNRLLAIFTACTVICVPFTMTAAFFSMEKFDDTPALSIQKFKLIVGTATGAIVAAGFLLTYLLRNWRDARRRLYVSAGYEEWKYQEIEKRLGDLEPHRYDKHDGEDGWRPKQYQRLAIEKIALSREREKYDRSGNDLDLSRRQWAVNRWAWVGSLSRVTAEVKKRARVSPIASPQGVPSNPSGGSQVSLTPMVQQTPSGQAPVSGSPAINPQSQSPPTPTSYKVLTLSPDVQVSAGPSGSQISPDQNHGSLAASSQATDPNQLSLTASAASSTVSTPSSQMTPPVSAAPSTAPNPQIQGILTPSFNAIPGPQTQESWRAYGC